MTNSDKPNNLFAHAQLRNSVNKVLNTKKELTQTSNETNWRSFDQSLAGCLENIILSKYFSFNAFLQNIKYCNVAFSLLFRIA